MEFTLKIIDLVALLLVLGGAGGFLSGLLGVGGGILFVPGLYYCLKSVGLADGNAMHMALGTSMAIVFITGLTSARAHAQKKSVEMAIVRSFGPYIVLGVALGTLFAAVVSGGFLKNIFAATLLLMAPYMALGREAAIGGATHVLPARLQNAICTAIGALSSMIGVGGAIMNVPLMIYLGHPMRKAIGTSAALGVLISLPATLGYMLTGALSQEITPPLSLGYVNFLALAVLVPAAVFMAPMGVQTSHRLSRKILRRIFSVVLVAVAIRMMLS